MVFGLGMLWGTRVKLCGVESRVWSFRARILGLGFRVQTLGLGLIKDIKIK
jgi:hypothetical protein